jgi:hypothetical protein
MEQARLLVRELYDDFGTYEQRLLYFIDFCKHSSDPELSEWAIKNEEKLLGFGSHQIIQKKFQEKIIPLNGSSL